MKRVTSIVMALALIGLFASCNSMKVIDDAEIKSLPFAAYLVPQEYDKRLIGRPGEIMSAYVSEHELAPEKLPFAQVYKEGDVIRNYLGGNIYQLQLNMDYTANSWMQQGSNSHQTFDQVIHSFPTKNVRETDDSGNVYLMYMLGDGSRLYLFFRNDSSLSGYISGSPVLMAKKLSYHDFESLKVGDSIEKAAEIEPSVLWYISAFKDFTQYMGQGLLERPEEKWRLQLHPLQSTHILTDGVLRIEYSLHEDGSFTVKNIIFDENFKLPSYVSKIGFITEGPDSYDLYRVHDVDYAGGQVVLEKDSP